MYEPAGQIPPNWVPEDDGTAIQQTFTFATFAQAMSFMAAVAPVCDRLDHHPEWRNVYDRVEVRLTTHHTGSLTRSDTDLAQAMDAVAATLRGL